MKTDMALFKCLAAFFKDYAVNVKKLSPNTIRAYQNALTLFLDYIKKTNGISLNMVTVEMFSAQAVTGFLSELKERNCSNATCNLRLQAIKTFVGFAAKTSPEFIVLQDSLNKIKPFACPIIRAVLHMSESAVKTLLATPNRATKKGFRDFLIMTLLYDTGARISEVMTLRICDLRLIGTPKVILNGKGNKVRYVPLMKVTVEHIESYLRFFHEPSCNHEDYLFYIIRDGMKRKITDDNIRKMLIPYACSAKAKNPEVPARVNPHMFRHSRAMHLYQNGMPLPLVSQWLGHSDFETTMVYAYADTEMKRKAIDAATPHDSPLRGRMNSDRYRVSDEETLKKLCGLL